MIKAFKGTFEVRVWKEIDRFLGVSVEDKGNEDKLRTEPSLDKIFGYFKMSDCKPTASPLPAALDHQMIIVILSKIKHHIGISWAP